MKGIGADCAEGGDGQSEITLSSAIQGMALTQLHFFVVGTPPIRVLKKFPDVSCGGKAGNPNAG